VEYTVSEGIPDKYTRYDDEDSSTLVCPCGQSFSWEGFSEDLRSWLADHDLHEAPPTPPAITFTPLEHNEGLLIGLSDEALDALEDTDEVRQERARRRQELAATPADLLKFFTRRETDYWPRKDRSKYQAGHTGAQQLLRQETGMTRSQAREAVLRFHRERAAELKHLATEPTVPINEKETVSGEA
jgi:hypothetical protein